MVQSPEGETPGTVTTELQQSPRKRGRRHLSEEVMTKRKKAEEDAKEKKETAKALREEGMVRRSDRNAPKPVGFYGEPPLDSVEDSVEEEASSVKNQAPVKTPSKPNATAKSSGKRKHGPSSCSEDEESKVDSSEDETPSKPKHGPSSCSEDEESKVGSNKDAVLAASASTAAAPPVVEGTAKARLDRTRLEPMATAMQVMATPKRSKNAMYSKNMSLLEIMRAFLDFIPQYIGKDVGDDSVVEFEAGEFHQAFQKQHTKLVPYMGNFSRCLNKLFEQLREGGCQPAEKSGAPVICSVVVGDMLAFIAFMKEKDTFGEPL